MPTIPLSQIATRLLGAVEDLHLINAKLSERGLPPYYFGGTAFNTDYRIANTPRYVWVWRRLRLELAEFYLYYMPKVPPDREPNILDEIVISLR